MAMNSEHWPPDISGLNEARPLLWMQWHYKKTMEFLSLSSNFAKKETQGASYIIPMWKVFGYDWDSNLQPSVY